MSVLGTFYSLAEVAVGMDDEEIDEIKEKLHQLETEHRDLDIVIAHLLEEPYHDELRVQRMKKRKLQLKDMIYYYHNLLVPDEPA